MRYTWMYGGDRRTRRGYYVLNNMTDTVMFASDSKSECITKAQELNGFLPIDGDERTYIRQVNATRQWRRTVDATRRWSV